MNVESAEVELAYTYAWWLTGEDAAARTAVLTAVDRPDVPGADPDLRLEILLRRVRAAAVSSPTMCPASELALLHDAIGLGLDAAAGLVTINAREARTELAHGRLEALGRESEIEMVAPERLGGLAVGNPADVAAARQNPKLGRLRELILAGRDELVDVSRITVPADLLDAVANRRRPGPIDDVPMEAGWFDEPVPAPFDETEDAATNGDEADADDLIASGGVPRAAEDDAAVDEQGEEQLAEDERSDAELAEGELAEDEPAEDELGWGEPADAEPADAEPADAEPGRDWLDDVRLREEDEDDPALVAVAPESGSGALDELEQSEEIDLSASATTSQRRPKERTGSRRGWLVLALACIAGVIGLIATQIGPVGDADPDARPTQDVAQGPVTPPPAASPDPSTPTPDAVTPPAEVTNGPDVAPADDVSPAPTPTDEPDPADPTPTNEPDATAPPAGDVPFTVSDTGVAVGIGSDPSSDNPTADPFEPVSITVDYTGAVEGDVLLVDWTVEGQPYDTERAALSPLLETARFTKQVPEEGWPVGQHVLLLTLERTGEVVGEARFQVAG